MRNLLLFILITATLMPLRAAVWRDYPTESLLDSLDYYMTVADKYDASARRRIYEKKRELHRLPTSRHSEMYRRIGFLYTHVDIDSAFRYYDLSLRAALFGDNREEVARTQLARIRTMPYKGLVYQSITEINDMDVTGMPQDILATYHYTRHLVFENAAQTYAMDSISAIFMRESMASLNSMKPYMVEGTENERYYHFWMRLNPASATYDPSAIRELQDIVDTMAITNPNLPIASAILARNAEGAENDEDTERYYTLSAIADIVQGNSETTSLHRLGKFLYDHGDTRRAYDYLTCALSRSVNSGARLRALEAAETLPRVIDTAERRDRANNRLLIYIVVALVLLTLTLVVLLVNMYRHRRNLAELKERLRIANVNKDVYIRKMLEVYGDNIDAVESFNETAARKLKALQSRDLLRMVEENVVVQKQLQKFYNVFDPAFRELYPDFIERVNELLLPESRFTDDNDTALSAELRMVALMILGITEGRDLARFLGLSLNTVYTYRTKLKNRAIDRSGFEENLRKIGSLA